MGEARCKQQRRRFTQNAPHRQDAAGDDAARTSGQHHRADDPPLSGPQAKGPLAVALGHSSQALLGRSHDGGQVHDNQRQRTRQQRGSQHAGKHQHPHKAVDDGRDAGEGFRRVLDDRHQTLICGVLGQIDRRPCPQRQDDQQGGKDDVDGVQNVRQDTDGVRQVAGFGGQQLPGQVGEARSQHIAYEEQRQSAHQQHRQGAQQPHYTDIGPPGWGDWSVQHNQPSFCPLRKKFNTALISMMNRNSTRAMENSACLCRPLE